MIGPPVIPSASALLLRTLISQNEEALRGLRQMPPSDWESPSGRQHLMVVQELREQTVLLNERLAVCLAHPLPPRPRRSWRDIPPSISGRSLPG